MRRPGSIIRALTQLSESETMKGQTLSKFRAWKRPGSSFADDESRAFNRRRSMEERLMTKCIGHPVPEWDVAHRLPNDRRVGLDTWHLGAVFRRNSKHVALTERWRGPSGEFNSGVVAVVFQLAMLALALKGWTGSDQLSQEKKVPKLAGAVASDLCNIIETVSETISKAPNNPLFTAIIKQRPSIDEWEKIGVHRGVTAQVASILLDIAIANFKVEKIKDWISRCNSNVGNHYRSLDTGLMAFNSAMGG